MKPAIKAIALAVAATGAQADGINYLSGDLSYDSLSFPGEALNSTTLDGHIEYQMGNFLVFGKVEARKPFFPGPTRNTSVYGLDIGYKITPNVLGYVGASRLTVGSNAATFYNAGLQGDVGGGLSLAVDLSQANNGGLTYRNTSIMGEYQASDKFSVGLKRSYVNGLGAETAYNVVYAEYDSGPLEVDISAQFGGGVLNATLLSAKYEFGGKYRGLASYYTSSRGGPQSSSYSAGVGYNVMNNVWLDAEIGQLDTAGIGSTQARTASISLSYETGRQTRLIDRTRGYEQGLMERDPRFSAYTTQTGVGFINF